MHRIVLICSLSLLAACSTSEERALEPTTQSVGVWTGQTWLYLPIQRPASLASLVEDSEAKKFSPVPDKAVLYIYRNQFRGSAWQIPITLNGKLIGSTGGYTFFQKILSPGPYVVESWAENIAHIELNLEAGKIYYLRHKTRTGTSKIRAELDLVDEIAGRKGVEQAKLLLDEAEK